MNDIRNHHRLRLPRSGTSLMMQMLAAGGIEIVTDCDPRRLIATIRRGYLEFERVKKIKQDSSWLPETRGKAFKMVSQLLYDLPPSERYRVIFMERDLDEVLASQEKMLERLGRAAAPREQMQAGLPNASRSFGRLACKAAAHRRAARELQ